MHDLQWYVLMVTMRGEQEIRERLMERVKGAGLVLPMLRRKTWHRGVKRENEVPVFPGYLFIGFEDVPPWRGVFEVKDVRDVIRTEGAPARIAGRIVADLQTASIMGAFDSGARLKAGETVKIIRGPLGEFCGKVSRLRGNHRLEVLFGLLGLEQPVVLPLDDVRRVA